MLKLKNIIWLAALVVTVSSCDDYLDTPPVDKITSDGFYQTLIPQHYYKIFFLST